MLIPYLRSFFIDCVFHISFRVLLLVASLPFITNPTFFYAFIVWVFIYSFLSLFVYHYAFLFSLLPIATFSYFFIVWHFYTPFRASLSIGTFLFLWRQHIQEESFESPLLAFSAFDAELFHLLMTLMLFLQIPVTCRLFPLTVTSIASKRSIDSPPTFPLILLQFFLLISLKLSLQTHITWHRFLLPMTTIFSRRKYRSSSNRFFAFNIISLQRYFIFLQISIT